MAVRISSFGLDCRYCSEAQKVDRGCEQDSPVPGKWKVNDWTFQRCPVKIVTTQSLQYLEAYELFDSGILPHAGGYLNNSQKYLDAMRTIKREIASYRSEEQANARKANGKR